MNDVAKPFPELYETSLNTARDLDSKCFERGGSRACAPHKSIEIRFDLHFGIYGSRKLDRE